MTTKAFPDSAQARHPRFGGLRGSGLRRTAALRVAPLLLILHSAVGLAADTHSGAIVTAPGTSRAEAADPKRIYIALDDHTDYMWTADEATYQSVFLESLDYYLDQKDLTSTEASDYQSRFNADGSFWIWTYEKNRSSSQFDRLISAIRSGHISMPLTALVSTYGGTPLEAILRGMYYPGQLERRYNLRFPLAVSMENQSLPYGLGSVWSGAGAKYSWRGICGCVSQIGSAWDRPADAWWWVGPDGNKVLMKWNSMLTGNNAFMGGYAEARDTSNVINYVDTNAAFQARWPYPVIGAFGYGWDDLKTLRNDFPAVAKASTNSARRVIVSNEQDFFQDLEATSGATIPSLSVSYGNEWDLYSASMAEVTASVKRSVEKLRAAEAMATVVSLHDETFMSGRESSRDAAWMNLGLYWEHDWTADGPVGRDARRDWQRRVASTIAGYVNTLHADATTSLGALIAKSGSNPRYYVFNPLSWERSDFAEFAWTGSTSVQVIEVESGVQVPSQIVSRNGSNYLQLWAEAIPSLGYRTYEVRTGTGSTFSNAASVSGNVLENSAYKLTFSDRGAIVSLIDKTRGNRELAATVGGRALNDLGSGTGAVFIESQGPVSVTLKATSSSPLAHTTRVTLYRAGERVDISNELTQNFSNVLTWGYGFNVANPDVYHEEVGAVVKAKLTSQGGIYSTRNARYDWLSLQHFADINDGSGAYGVTLSNADVSFMKLGNSTAASLDTTTPSLSILAGGQVDGSGLGIPAQGGDAYFLQRFALRGHAAYDGASAMRFALEHQNPLVTGSISGGTALPEGSYTLGTTSDKRQIVWSLKPAEDGISTGLVARVWNMAGADAQLTLSLVPAISSASQLSHIETPIASIGLTGNSLVVPMKTAQIGTYLLVPTVDTGSDGSTDASGGCNGSTRIGRGGLLGTAFGSGLDSERAHLTADSSSEGSAGGAARALVACLGWGLSVGWLLVRRRGKRADPAQSLRGE